jgi:hypothetical protein
MSRIEWNRDHMEPGHRVRHDFSRLAWLDDRFLQAWLGIIHARIDGRVPEGAGAGGGRCDG